MFPSLQRTRPLRVYLTRQSSAWKKLKTASGSSPSFSYFTGACKCRARNAARCRARQKARKTQRKLQLIQQRVFSCGFLLGNGKKEEALAFIDKLAMVSAHRMHADPTLGHRLCPLPKAQEGRTAVALPRPTEFSLCIRFAHAKEKTHEKKRFHNKKSEPAVFKIF